MYQELFQIVKAPDGFSDIQYIVYVTQALKPSKYIYEITKQLVDSQNSVHCLVVIPNSKTSYIKVSIARQMWDSFRSKAYEGTSEQIGLIESIKPVV